MIFLGWVSYETALIKHTRLLINTELKVSRICLCTSFCKYRVSIHHNCYQRNNSVSPVKSVWMCWFWCYSSARCTLFTRCIGTCQQWQINKGSVNALLQRPVVSLYSSFSGLFVNYYDELREMKLQYNCLYWFTDFKKILQPVWVALLQKTTSCCGMLWFLGMFAEVRLMGNDSCYSRCLFSMNMTVVSVCFIAGL